MSTKQLGYVSVFVHDDSLYISYTATNLEGKAYHGSLPREIDEEDLIEEVKKSIKVLREGKR